jgi:hypothetical protein
LTAARRSFFGAKALLNKFIHFSMRHIVDEAQNQRVLIIRRKRLQRLPELHVVFGQRICIYAVAHVFINCLDMRAVEHPNSRFIAAFGAVYQCFFVIWGRHGANILKQGLCTSWL